MLNLEKNTNKRWLEKFPWLELCIFTANGPDSIPGQGTKIPQAIQNGQKAKQKKKEGSWKLSVDEQDWLINGFIVC